MSQSWNEQSVRADFRLTLGYVAPGMSPSLPFLFFASVLSFFLHLNTHSLLQLTATSQIIEQKLTLDYVTTTSLETVFFL